MSLRTVRAWFRRQRREADLAYLGPILHRPGSIAALMRACGWDLPGDIDGEPLEPGSALADLDDRPRQDALVVAAACRNAGSGDFLEIGTGLGRMTAVMARNAGGRTVHTVNIPPDEISAGGRMTTFAPSLGDIGSYARGQGWNNIRQILANTATWDPQLPPLSVSFIDGCHDARMVVSDTLAALRFSGPGSWILWHDFSPEHVHTFDWVAEVVRGVRMLVERRAVRGPILALKGSWVGAYRVP